MPVRIERKSTLLLDLARYLGHQADAFKDSGLEAWADHLRTDAERMERESAWHRKHEPPLPTLAEIEAMLEEARKRDEL